MSDAPLPPMLGEGRCQRADARAEEARNVRQRVDEAETRLDEIDSHLRGHETRLKCLEAPCRIVLRGFSAVREFMGTFDGGDFKGAKKTACIPSFVQEFRGKSGPEVAQLIEELNTLLCERNGWVVLGVFPLGGMLGDFLDGLLRLQPGGVGNRVSTLCSQISLSLQETHQVFQDRVRRDKGEGKAKGKRGAHKGRSCCSCFCFLYVVDGLILLTVMRVGTLFCYVARPILRCSFWRPPLSLPFGSCSCLLGFPGMPWRWCCWNDRFLETPNTVLMYFGTCICMFFLCLGYLYSRDRRFF